MEKFGGGSGNGGDGEGEGGNGLDTLKKEKLNLTPEEQAELDLLVRGINEKADLVKDINFEELEPSKLSKLLDKVQRVKHVLIGLGVLTAGGLLIADAIMNRNANFDNAAHFNTGSWEAIAGGLAALAGVITAVEAKLPRSGFNG